MGIQKRVFTGKKLTAIQRLISALERMQNSRGTWQARPEFERYDHLTPVEWAYLDSLPAKLQRMAQETRLGSGPDQVTTITINLTAWVNA